MPNPRRGRPAGFSGQAPVLNPEQIKRVLRLAKGRERNGSRAEVAFCLSIFLGLRAKEIAALRWGDIYDQNDEIREILNLKAAYTKGGKTRTSYLVAPKLRQILADYNKHFREWRNPNGPLLRSQTGGNMTASSMVRLLKQLYRDAGIPDASSHTGRRTFITNLAERG
ncbi:MAG: site-specific integrase [Rhizobiales bacterium]|nr:site-specific integrase [Hyphomicrobiales bacterium]